MPRYYVTFGYNTPQRDQFRAIEAEDYTCARNLIHETYGPKWAFMYDEAEFKGQQERYGLTEITPPLKEISNG